jgi:glycine/sarcosine N-methyltransferase
MDEFLPFYDAMAAHYHLIFQDWEMAMRRQGNVIASLLPPSESTGPVLDCACGIGTQSLALARLGFQVDASDLSPAEAARARQEAAARGLPIQVRVDDMRTLEKAPTAHYGAVLCMDNALPHLDSDKDIVMALRAMNARLRPGGVLVLSLRDYGPLIRERPTAMPPSF